ncbi:MAG: ABC transporter permease [Bacteroidetes bacterium]|nr:ABC transporter permease [Bacteroidota bacterium]
MFKNNLKIALRNLVKRKGYSFLNIFGLAIGIACCLLIFQYVAYERSYDKFQDDASRIVRVRLDNYQKGKLAWQSATAYPPIPAAMKKDFPEVEDFCRLKQVDLLLSNEARHVKFNETKSYFADPSVIKMFNIQLLKGNPNTALDGPDKILLSETNAKKYFGNEDPLGKRLTMRDNAVHGYEVTGIFKDYPANSHLVINHLVSYSTLAKELRAQGDTSNASETAWGWYDYYDYIKLKPGTDWKQLEKKLPAFCERYINNDEWRKTNNVKAQLYLIPLSDIHLYSNYNQEVEVNGSGKSVGFLFMISFFIIAIAWVNYTNLATARSLERAKEVGVRKVMGALRMDLIGQFLTESFLLNLLAFVLAFVVVLILAPAFNQLIGTNAPGGFFMPANYWFPFLSMFFAGTFLSGVYPAFILSGYHPVVVLKGLFKNTSKGRILRKGLIVGQFAISVILIAGTIIVYQQVQFMRQQKLGADINQTLVLEGAHTLRDSVYQSVFQPFKTSLLQQSDIKSVAASSSVMGEEITWTSGYTRVSAETKQAITLYTLGVDYDFLPGYDLKLIAGRNFSRDFATDQRAVLINEKAVEMLGFKNAEEAVNAKLSRGDTLTIVGVIANYHHQGMQKAIDPTLLWLRPNINQYYSVKINTTNLPHTLASIEKTWNNYFPNDPFNYFFLDDFFNQQYKADIRFGQVFGLFATLAIIIACFGLLGLSAYNVLQRTKEIGIRKVLGASVQNLLILLSREFIILVFVSLFVAIPVCWIVMHNWLQDFAYRITISGWVFILAGFLAVLIALATVGFQALKASMANPAKSLRTE